MDIMNTDFKFYSDEYRVKYTLDLLTDMCRKSDGEVTKHQIYDVFMGEFEPIDLEICLRRLQKRGDIYKPRPKVYRVVEV